MAYGNNGRYAFYLNGVQMLKDENAGITELLRESFQKSQDFFTAALFDDKLWDGEAREKLRCFYHLVVQYHGLLSGITPTANGYFVPSATAKMDCSDALTQAYAELYNSLAGFCSESLTYPKLGTIP